MFLLLRPGTRGSLGGSRSLNASTTSLAATGESKKSSAHDRTDVLASLERIQNFEEAFNKIKAATGVSGLFLIV